MKHALIVIGLGCLALGLSCKRKPAAMAPPAQPPGANKIVLRYHFAGAAQFAASTEGTQFKKIWAMRETEQFLDALVRRLAQASQDRLAKVLPGLETNSSVLFRPLFDDLLQAESFAELRATDKGDRELDLAIQLADDRAQVWSTNLWQAASSWQGAQPVTLIGSGFTGWESKKASASERFRFARAGQWVVLESGQTPRSTNLLQNIIAQGRPSASAKGYWLETDIDSAQLKASFPNTLFGSVLSDLQIKDFPLAHVAVSPSGENLLTSIRLEYAQAVPWKYESWQVPTNLIQNPRDSLISFTAARGLAPLLSNSITLDRLGWSPRPNQVYSWAYSIMPLQTYGAVPVQNAATLVNEVAPRIQAAISTNFTVNLRSEAQWYSNHTAMVWTELPFVVPFFLSMKSGEGEFFYFGLFPPPDSATNAPPPQELINSLARTNLLYYDWEITEERLRHWRALTSLADVFRFERTFPTNTPSQLWLTAVTTNLGNAVTEISLLPPKGLDFVRRAHLGLTGFELVALARWVDASNFPISGDQGPAPAGKNAASTPVKP